ncbi:MAG: AMP-binding protein [Pseudomonadales bacterium]
MQLSEINQAVAQARDRLGIPQELDEYEIRDYLALFKYALEQYADRPAYNCLGHVLSFSELDQLSDHFAAYLQSLEFMQPGDRVSLQLPNLLQWPVAAMGIIKAGYILVNTNPLYTDRELKHQLNDSGAKIVISLKNISKELEEIADQTSVQLVILTEVGDLLPTPRRQLTNFALKYVLRQVPRVKFENSVSFASVLADGAGKSLNPVRVKEEDVAVLQYTGGTTGISKGVMLTHKNLMSCMYQVACIYEKAEWTKGEMRMVTPLPLYHIYAFSVSFNHALYNGHENVLIPNPRDIRKFAKTLKNTPFDGMTGLNTLFNGLMNNKDFQGMDFSRVKLTLSGGMALSRSIADRWEALTGAKICEGYGLTESTGIMAVNSPEAPMLGTVGCIFSSTLVRIKDQQGNDLGVGEEGELWFKGPTMMAGFWEKPDDMAELMDEDGYMNTGDIARINDNGYLSIVDRTKDMIVVSGFNVYPNEIEEVVIAHPKIRECAVIAGQEEDGEYVRLFVVADQNDISAEEIREYCRQNLTGYKVPKTVTFVDEMPKSNVGKILRRELREKYPG